MAKNIWKEAIIEELMTTGIYTEEWAKDPKKALHHLACWHTECGMHFAQEERKRNSLKFKLEKLWYRTPFPYWLYKISKIQPPF
jgi:hypothetical protein